MEQNQQQTQRNLEKELGIYQFENMKLTAEKIALQVQLEDALKEVEYLKHGKRKREVTAK